MSPAGGADVVLVAHDGTAYEDGAALTRVASGAHVALLPPGDRNEWYSANPAYADAPRRPGAAAAARPAPSSGSARASAPWPCCTPSTAHPAPSPGCSCSRGASSPPSLTRRSRGSPGTSGSWTSSTSAAPTAARTVLTCGRDEENLHNNRADGAAARGAARRGPRRSHRCDLARRTPPAPATAAPGVHGMDHLIGLLLGTEHDWPRAFETLIAPDRPDPRPSTAPRTTCDASGSPSSRSTCATSRATTWSSTGSPTGTTTRASGSRRSR